MNTILRIGLVFSLCMFLSGTFLPGFVVASGSTGDFRAVDAYVAETMRRLPVKGLALGIVQGDQVVYVKGYGTANVRGDPVTPQTPFMLGSVTKTFTALAVQQLISAGKIDQNKPVQSYLPAFRLADDRNGAGVTIRHLLDHTSGITTQEGVAPYYNNPKATFSEVLDQLARYRPKYKPGEHEEYSNWNYALLREVVAQASGQTYASYVQQNILDPLDMSSASLADYHTLPHAATYDLNVFGFPVPYDEVYRPNNVGAAYLSASAEDMTHYLVAFLNRGQYQDHNLLPARRSGWYTHYWDWRSSDPEGARIAFSGGHNSTSAHIQIIPDHQLGVVLLMNTRLDEVIPSAPTVYDIATGIVNMMMDEPYSLPNFSGFTMGAIVLDGLMLIFIASIAWQALRLKNWKSRYQAAPRSRRMMAWLGILLNLLVCAAILALPLAFQVSWGTMLSYRPDFAIPVLTVGAGLGVLGLFKAAASFR